jgi:hypothetical protein
MSDVKNWIFLIVLVNIIFLPIMWLREDKVTPKVLGVSESTELNGDLKNQTKEDSEDFDLGVWFGENVWKWDTKPATSTQVRTIGGEIVSSNLPPRAPLQSFNTSQNLDSMLSGNQGTATLEGKIVQRDGFKNNLAVKDMELGDKVRLECQDREIVAVIDGAFLSFDGVLAVASQNIFSRLGIDSTQTKELNCKITKIG